MNKDLRALIKTVASDHPDATPTEIAEFVAKLTPEENLVDFYAEALVEIVAAILGVERRGSMDNALSRKGNWSPKLERRRKWWADMLASRVPVKDGWKRIAECTVDDLQFCVDERETQILRIEQQIGNYRNLIALMVEHKAKTVSDLPPQDKWDTK